MHFCVHLQSETLRSPKSMLPEPSASKQRSTPSSSAGDRGQPKRLRCRNEIGKWARPEWWQITSTKCIQVFWCCTFDDFFALVTVCINRNCQPSVNGKNGPLILSWQLWQLEIKLKACSGVYACLHASRRLPFHFWWECHHHSAGSNGRNGKGEKREKRIVKKLLRQLRHAMEIVQSRPHCTFTYMAWSISWKSSSSESPWSWSSRQCSPCSPCSPCAAAHDFLPSSLYSGNHWNDVATDSCEAPNISHRVRLPQCVESGLGGSRLQSQVKLRWLSELQWVQGDPGLFQEAEKCLLQGRFSSDLFQLPWRNVG